MSDLFCKTSSGVSLVEKMLSKNIKRKRSQSMSRVLSTRLAPGVPVIYLAATSPPQSIVLPSEVLQATWAGSPQPSVYADFQPLRCTAHMSPYDWWSLTPPSHPYHFGKWRLFSSTLLNPCGLLPVKKQRALCCPDFPLASPVNASDRLSGYVFKLQS